MKAKFEATYNRDRMELGKKLPLKTPLRITISCSQICNFKCFYCTHSLPHDEIEKTGFHYTLMPFEDFKIFADQLKEFTEPIELIVFSGMGEPLLNKDLDKMVAYLKKNGLANRVELYTNGTLLNEDWTQRLVNAGLDDLKVSIQGLNSMDYQKVSGYSLNFEKFLEKLQYFYENRKNCSTYIKIIDSSLKSKQDEELFYKMFGNICDRIFIEHLTDCQPLKKEDSGFVDNIDYKLSMYNEPAPVRNVCPFLFYGMYLDVDGDLYPCMQLGMPKDFAVGNIFLTDVKTIWNSDTVRNLRLDHLNMKRKSCYICDQCFTFTSCYHVEDDLDAYVEKLIPLFNKSELKENLIHK